jgi:hypothetical protein
LTNITNDLIKLGEDLKKNDDKNNVVPQKVNQVVPQKVNQVVSPTVNQQKVNPVNREYAIDKKTAEKNIGVMPKGFENNRFGKFTEVKNN